MTSRISVVAAARRRLRAMADQSTAHANSIRTQRQSRRAFLFSAAISEQELHGELHDAGIERARDRSEGRRAGRCAGRAEVRPVEQIEDIRADLERRSR